MRPMLAAKYDPERQKFPCYASPKLDGVRALTLGGSFLSRSLKRIPNEYCQTLARHLPEGLDGELVVGEPQEPGCIQRSVSGVMTISGVPDVTYYVFDVQTGEPFETRLRRLYRETLPDFCKLVPQTLLTTPTELEVFYEECLAAGYEGAITRTVSGPYKHGRSTQREGYLVKLKSFVDCEGEVIGVTELFHNENPQEENELGLSSRSTRQEGKRPAGILGTLTLRVLNGDFAGQTVEVGTGFTAAQRQALWDSPPIGAIVTFSYTPYGSLNRPRIPVFRSFREDL